MMQFFLIKKDFDNNKKDLFSIVGYILLYTWPGSVHDICFSRWGHNELFLGVYPNEVSRRWDFTTT